MWLDEADSREIRIFLRKPRVLAHDYIGGGMDICYFYFIHLPSHPLTFKFLSEEAFFSQLLVYMVLVKLTTPDLGWSGWPSQHIIVVGPCDWFKDGYMARYFWKETWCREDVVAKLTWLHDTWVSRRENGMITNAAWAFMSHFCLSENNTCYIKALNGTKTKSAKSAF